MDYELEKELKRKYPLAFGDLHNPETTLQNSCMVWGIETGNGWHKLIDEMASKLEIEIQEWINDPNNQEFLKENPEFKPKIIQIKEKYATLRCYMSCSTDEMEAIIEEAEDKSATTCEACGAPGEIRGAYWLYTACDACEEKRVKK